MGAIASQITSLTIVYSTVYSDADQRIHQSSASLAFVWGIHRGPVNSPHKWPVTRKMFPFDDVIMTIPESAACRNCVVHRYVVLNWTTLHRCSVEQYLVTMWRLLATTHRDSDNPERCVYYDVTMDTIYVVAKRVEIYSVMRLPWPTRHKVSIIQ